MATAATMKVLLGANLSIIPSAKAPPGFQSNLTDPVSNHDGVVIANVTLMAVTFFFVFARLGMNIIKNRKIGWDDYLVVFGFTLAYVWSILNFFTAKFGHHLWDCPVSWFGADYQKETALENMFLPITLFVTKTGIFGWFLHIFHVYRTMQLLIYGGIAFAFCIYFPSIPLAAWVYTPHAVLSLVLDLYIFVIPMPTLMKLNLPRRRKYWVLSVFATAILGVTAAVIALYFRYKLWKGRNYDVTWLAGWTFIASTVEIYVALIVVCMPTFASFLKTYLGDSVYYIRSKVQGVNAQSLPTTPTRLTPELVEAHGKLRV